MIACRAFVLLLAASAPATVSAITVGGRSDPQQQAAYAGSGEEAEVSKGGGDRAPAPPPRRVPTRVDPPEDAPRVERESPTPRRPPPERAPSAGFFARAALLETDQYRDLASELEAEGALQEIAAEFNQVIHIPVPVALRFAECGEPNAFYDPDAREISLCFELMELFQETLSEQLDEADVEDALAGAMVFILLHEVGHALVDVLELPITGREEDAVDQLSAWMLIDGEEGNAAVLSAAATFYSDAELSDADFADEHSLDQQRYFNMVCWVYGSEDEPDQDLIDEWELPEERAERCGAEYAQLDRSWSRLLEEHIKSN